MSKENRKDTETESNISRDELIERIGKAMAEMDNESLAALYNENFGSGMRYDEDDMFYQDFDKHADDPTWLQL
jgi:hypothetical protein